MSGARPKVYAGRSSSSSSDNHEDTPTPDTAALCLDLGELAISSRDAQVDQDGLQLSLACQQPGTVQGISYAGHVEGKDNVLLQQGDNSELTIASPLIQHVTVVTYADGTEVTRTYDDGEEVPQNGAHPAAIDRLDDLASLAAIPTRHQHTNGRKPKIPSAEQLDWLKRYLKRRYRTKLGEFQPLPWFDDLHLQLKDVYTNLQVVRKDRADRDLPLRRSGRGETGKRSSNSARDSRNDPGLIRIEQIFDVNRNGEVPRVEDHGEFEEEEETEKPKRIRIEGPPGIGKSIQCHKLACDWSSNSFQQFDFAFLLQMRYLSGDVKDAIFDQLLPEDTEMDREALWSYIRQGTNQPKVLFILDGLDELKPQVRQTSDVIKLIQQKILTDATVVITSRPNECTADLKGCPLHCNITGYTMANSKEYIHKYFKGRPELANSLGARIARDKDLADLATNPLNTMLLCIIWEDNDGSLPSTITSLFDSLVLCIVKRYCKKTHDITVTGTTIPDSIDTKLAEMGKVAWEGLLRNEVNFDEADFQSTDRGIEMFKIGFLTKDLGASRIDASFVWSFLHKTFQEYFAAVFLSKDAAMQEDFGGSAPLGLFEFTPRPLSLVEPHVPRQQASVSGPTFKDRVLQSLNDDSLHQVFLFLVGILKKNARPVFECFRRHLHTLHLQVLRSSDDEAARNRYRALFRFFIKCLIESENGSDLVRGLPYCFPEAIDVSDLFAHVYDDTWSSALIFMLDAQCQWVTRVDINLSTHEMDKELAAAFIRNRFVKHLSITNLFLDDVIAPSADAEQEDFPLFEVLKRSLSTLEFFVRIQGITTSDRDVALMRRLFHAMSQSTQLSSAILKLDMKRTNLTGKLCLPVDLLSTLSTLTTVKLWLYGAFRHHAITNVYYEVGESNKGGGRYGEIDENFEYYDGQSVDDQAFNESIEKLLRESKSIQTFSLQIMYKCIVFEHAKNLPSALASVISDTEVLRNIVLHFSFYHKQRDLKHPLTYSELTRLNIFGLVEALSHNRTLQTFELFIDDDGLSRNGEDTLSGMEEDVAHEATSSSYNKQIQSSRVNANTETDQVRLWPSIASVFQNNTALYRLNLTFKYCLTDSSESVQRMTDAVLALSDNKTLRTVKLHVILYRAQTNGHLGVSNIDKVFHALGEVVSTNITLKCLHFHKTDDPWRRACRVRSCTKLSQRDESWHVTVSKPAVEQLASATQRNMVLREFSVMGFSCEDEGVQEVIDEMVSSARDSLNITISIS